MGSPQSRCYLYISSSSNQRAFLWIRKKSPPHKRYLLFFGCGKSKESCGQRKKKKEYSSLVRPFLSYIEKIPTELSAISTLIHTFSTNGGKRAIQAKTPKSDFLLITCLLFDPVSQLSDLVIDRTTLCHQLADLSVGMHHCCVIAPPESLANFWKRKICQFAT